MAFNGVALRYHRIRANMSQIDLGARLGLSQQTIAGYEKGSRKPNLAIIQMLAEVLGVEPAQLEMQPGDDIPKNTRVKPWRPPAAAEEKLTFIGDFSGTQQSFSPELLRLIEVAMRAGERERRAAADMLEALTGPAEAQEPPSPPESDR